MSKFGDKSTSPSGPWIYDPWLDLIVGCGAWSAPLLVLSYSTVASSARTWSVIFYVLALFFNYPHYMATLYRAYHRREDFEKYRVFTVHVTALLLATLLLSHFWARLLPWIFTIYLTWSPWHYSGQNYGLFMMFAQRAGANPDKPTRRALYGAFIVSYLILFLAFHTGPSTDPLFISLGLPALVGDGEQIVLGIAFVVLSMYGLARLARETGWRKLTPSLTLFSSQFLWFLLPSAMSLIKGLEIPQNRYSTGVLAVMHSAQYLWITSYYARREATNQSAARNWRPLAYFGVLMVGGIALFVPGPWLASRAFHHDFTASFLIFTALVNIHHFILDGAIWKLRDGRIASLLLNSPALLSEAGTKATGKLAFVWQWLTGNTAGARRLRIGTALALLIWGTLDQARYYWAIHSSDLADLKRAARLDSLDTPLQMRLARQALESGDAEQAEKAWRTAIQSTPADPAPRQALLQFLLDSERFDEAFNLTEASLKYAPRDANLLIDRGLLELQRGHAEQALASWDQALAVDPNQPLAHLYLATEFDREGKFQPASSHYQSFLQKIAQEHPNRGPAPDRVIGVVMRMADCQARSSQLARAVKSYQLAQTLAAQTGLGKLESMAAVNQAELEARDGKLDDALELYQHALKLDESMHDDQAGAADWVSYGRFLDQTGFPPRLAYACMVKAQMEAKSGTNPAVPTAIQAAQRQLEKRLGAVAEAVRRSPALDLQEALTLRR